MRPPRIQHCDFFPTKSLEVVNKPIGSDEFTSASVFLQLMAVGNQAGKTFVWDIGVDDPTKARYSFLVVNFVLIGSWCEKFI